MTDPTPSPPDGLPQLQVRRGADAAGIVLELVGELDLQTAPQVELHIREIAILRPRRLLIDLGAVSFMDSSGLRVLIEARQMLPDSGVQLTLRRGARQVERLFEVTGVNSGFTFEQ